MESSSIRVSEERLIVPGSVSAESPVSAISWSAIIAGAFAIAGIGLILLAVGAGLGFASISPWSNSGPPATTFTVAAAIWLLIVQWLSAAFGGYLTGRLRTKWVSVASDEIYFRYCARFSGVGGSRGDYCGGPGVSHIVLNRRDRARCRDGGSICCAERGKHRLFGPGP